MKILLFWLIHIVTSVTASEILTDIVAHPRMLNHRVNLSNYRLRYIRWLHASVEWSLIKRLTDFMRGFCRKTHTSQDTLTRCILSVSARGIVDCHLTNMAVFEVHAVVQSLVTQDLQSWQALISKCCLSLKQTLRAAQKTFCRALSWGHC